MNGNLSIRLNIDNEVTYNQYWEGVELLDYDDTGAENIFKSLIKMHPYYIDAYVHIFKTNRCRSRGFSGVQGY